MARRGKTQPETTDATVAETAAEASDPAADQAAVKVAESTEADADAGAAEAQSAAAGDDAPGPDADATDAKTPQAIAERITANVSDLSIAEFAASDKVKEETDSVDRRRFTVLDPVSLDRIDYAAGAEIDITVDEHAGLHRAGVVFPWEDGAEIEPDD